MSNSRIQADRNSQRAEVSALGEKATIQGGRSIARAASDAANCNGARRSQLEPNSYHTHKTNTKTNTPMKNTPHYNRSNLRSAATLAVLLSASIPSLQAFEFQKDFNIGNAKWGARVKLESHDEFDRKNDRYKLSAEAIAKGRVLGKEASVAEATGAVTIDSTASTNVDCQLKLIGKTVWQLDNDFQGSISHDRIGKTKFIKEATLAKATFVIGPVPVTVKGGASLAAYTELSTSFSADTSQVSADLNYGPVIDVAATASATVNLKLASAGVEGSLGLLKQKLALGSTISFLDAKAKFSSATKKEPILSTTSDL